MSATEQEELRRLIEQTRREYESAVAPLVDRLVAMGARAPSAISIDRQIAAVRDELTLRRRVYPRWIAAGKMDQPTADRRLAEMEAVRATLEGLRDQQRPQLFA